MASRLQCGRSTECGHRSEHKLTLKCKPKRKKWAIEKANEIWTLRGDLETVELVSSKKKKDDMSDCLLHVLSYIICNYYG